MSRETKLKAVSRYWTQYSRLAYVPLRANSKSRNPKPWKTSSMISGVDLFWKIRQSAVRVRNQSQGTTSAR